MKNFETLYKVLMNESDYEDIVELETAEDSIGSMNPDDVTPRLLKIEKIAQSFPELSDEEVEKIVDSGLYDAWMRKFESKSEKDYSGEIDEFKDEFSDDTIYSADEEDIPDAYKQYKRNSRFDEV